LTSRRSGRAAPRRRVARRQPGRGRSAQYALVITQPARQHRARTLQRREALLRAAVEVAAERGVAGTSHRVIAAKAGLPPATTTYFFSSIEDLLSEAVTLALSERLAEIEALSAGMAGTTLGVDELADLVVTALMDSVDTLAVAQLDFYVSANRMPSLRPIVARILGAFERLAEAALEAASVPDPALGAEALVAMADGFELHRRARPRGDADREALRTGVHALLTGLMAEAPAPARRARPPAAR
jgi:DNA-binding transcriptional regulator YbjK